MIRTLYIFVEIAVDSPHLSSTIRSNFPSKRSEFRRKILGIGSSSSNDAASSSTDQVQESSKGKKLKKIEIETESQEDQSTSIESRFQETLDIDEKIQNPLREEGQDEEIGGNRDREEEDDRPTHFALVATVQFIGALQGLKESLERIEPKPLPRSNGNGEGNRLMITDDPSSSSSPNPTTSNSTQDSTSTPTSTSTSTWYSSSYLITVPQSKPLSPGEVLGCTSPQFTSPNSNKNGSSPDALIYLGDGRFHLESAMIANPRLPAFRYDPYSKTLVRERYDHERMRLERGKALDLAKESVGKEEGRSKLKREKGLEKKLKKVEEDLKERITFNDSEGMDQVKEEEVEIEVERKKRERENSWGLILGTLGRQGSLKVLKHLQDSLILPQITSTTTKSTSTPTSIPSIPILLSELSPQKLSLFGPNLSIFVQTSCPRLSIDWGNAFEKPLLSPYEATVALGRVKGWDRSDRIKGLGTRRGEKLDQSKNGTGNEKDQEGKGDYPMDFYSDDSPGPWTPRFGMGRKKKEAVGGGGGGGGKNALLLKKRNQTKVKEESVD